MGEKTGIAWTESTWTPIRARSKATGKAGWHCVHVTDECSHCYSESINRDRGTGLPFKPGHAKDIDLFLDEKLLTDPLRWKRGRMIFVCSMTDLFADFVHDVWIDRVFAVMALSPQHTFQCLTKRPERMREYCSDPETPFRIAQAMDQAMDALRGFNVLRTWPLPGVWLGVSAGNQDAYDQRWPILARTPAIVRFVSYEPALGPLRLSDGPKPDWVICGAESGPGARPCDLEWVRSIRDQCAIVGVKFFFKQWVEHGRKTELPRLDGRVWADFPHSPSAEATL
jgi:protein gp37